MDRYEKMTDEQLIQKLRDGDNRIVDYIMEKYKNLVRKEANAMYLLGGENDDLIQEGMIGLFKAVQNYDLAQETSFYNFARLCITRQIRSSHSSLPESLKLFRYLRTCRLSAGVISSSQESSVSLSCVPV